MEPFGSKICVKGSTGNMKYRIETERVDLFDVNMMITLCVKLKAEVPFEKLETAFYAACALHEVLSNKVVIEPSGEAFYVENDSPQNRFEKTSGSLEELVFLNERKRFRIEEGEYLRGFDTPDGLVFLMHHLGGDGKSLLYFTETFMRCLAGEHCDPVPFRTLTLEELPGNPKLPLFYRAVTGLWNRKWRSEKRSFSFEDLDAAYDRFWKERRTLILKKRYEKAELEELLLRSRKAGVSLTAYLITEWIRDNDTQGSRDSGANGGTKPVKGVKTGRNAEPAIGLAADGRMDGNRSMGNQATGISIRYRYQRDRSFEENARAVHALMKKSLTDSSRRYFVLRFMGRLEPSLRDALNLERAGYFHCKTVARVAESLGYGTRCRDLSITNLTRADIPLCYGAYEIEEIIFLPPIVSYAKNVIGIVTAGDVMYVTRHVYEDLTVS